MVREGSRELAHVRSARATLAHARHEGQLAQARFEAAVVEAATSGVSQREIAASAGVSQPFVSQLVTARRGRFVPSTPLGYLLASRRREVQHIVERYRCRNVAVFGSVARGDDRPDSDIDLLVDIPDDMGLFTLARMEQEIAEALGVPVDVVPARLLKAEVRGTAGVDAVPL